jgi:GT2 family glycosyltransferase
MMPGKAVDKPPSPTPARIEVSVCIVTYHARDLLRECLTSLRQNTAASFEVIVVDNGSHDGTEAMLAEPAFQPPDFPEVRFTENPDNAGFTRPMNQALRQAQGQVLVQLNPDTVILPGALDKLLVFLQEHPEAGICGPKVLNSDRSLQKPCRRGEPTPWAVLTYFLGLARLFPKSRLFGQYLMNYMDEDQTHVVAGVAGSCMMIRRTVVEQIGYLDERFFAYQEDADFCYRARQAGWQVFYMPEAQIIHYGGLGGSRVQPYRSIIEWHRSYFRYYKKYLAKNYFFLFNWLYYAAMLVKLGLSLLRNSFRGEKYAGPKRP